MFYNLEKKLNVVGALHEFTNGTYRMNEHRSAFSSEMNDCKVVFCFVMYCLYKNRQMNEFNE